ncbi:MAG TPA: ATP-binding protein [Candidatus Limnocylindria bacterium]|jgi:two-component system phosphate regulon sensor histidine kinase PhoR
MTRERAAEAVEALLARSEETVLVLVDDKLRIARAGAGAEQLAERPSDQLVGMSLIAAFGSAELDAIARQAQTSGTVALGESVMGRLGRRSFGIEAVPLSGGGLVVSLHDRTDQRRAERIRRDFVANISHELRTPLASIKLLAETLSGGAVDDRQTARDFSLQIEREVDQLAQLVDELLDLSMIESGETKLAIEPVEPGVLVRDVGERIGPVAERRGVTVRVDHGSTPDGPQVAADPARLGQALLNLAHNAVKYSHPGGEVRIGWEDGPACVRFTVADDGIGIPEAHRERIFERFYKVDRSRAREGDETPGGSAGLGLAIVRHLAEAHGGGVGVESEEDVGSTFWIEIPYA